MIMSMFNKNSSSKRLLGSFQVLNELCIFLLVFFSNVITITASEWDTLFIDESQSHRFRKYQPLRVKRPNGGDRLRAGEPFSIEWRGDATIAEISHVRLEYSTDNGTTYTTIADSVPNTGEYEWLVPDTISSFCRIRISDASNSNDSDLTFIYNFEFNIPDTPLSPGKLFTFYLGKAPNQKASLSVPRISFEQLPHGNQLIQFQQFDKEIGRLSPGWHRLKLRFSPVLKKASLWLNGGLILKEVPLTSNIAFSSTLSFAGGNASAEGIRFDDIRVGMSSDPNHRERDFFCLFNDSFQEYPGGGMFRKSSGWYTTLTGKKVKKTTPDQGQVYLSSIPALRKRFLIIKPGTGTGEGPIAVKTLDFPPNNVFDISDSIFEIRANKSGKKALAYKGIAGSFGRGPNDSSQQSNLTTGHSKNSIPVSRRMETTPAMTDTYYIYSYDGKLMAEYDHDGNCIRDYIYLGNRLIAEYFPQTDTFYYYMNDQINSTRIVTDDTGTIVHSSAHGPYGEKQKTWINTYDPKLKFSGKEREAYSDLDYFGARYYDHNRYRFISVDPILNREEALYNPQHWNLYAYCRNNPIKYYDPDGRAVLTGFLAYNIIKWGGIAIMAALAGKAIHDTWPKKEKYPDADIAIPAKQGGVGSSVADAISSIEAADTNAKGGGKTGKKINKKRKDNWDQKIEKAQEAKKSAKNKTEKKYWRDQIKHFRNQKKNSEEHARVKQK
jgi:RHS repeat-associated protein